MGPQCLTKPKSLRTQLPQLIHKASHWKSDPWEEVAELSEQPKETATHRMASLIERLPGGRLAPGDSRAIAGNLIELLSCRGSSKVPLVETSHVLRHSYEPSPQSVRTS
jgi:hypothetical protein